MSPTELRDFLLSLPWVGILVALVVVIGIIIALVDPDGRKRLMDLALRIIDAFAPSRPAAVERRAEQVERDEAQARDIRE